MSLLHVYYLLLVACFTLSLFYLKYPVVRWLGALLFVSIVTESIVEFIGKRDHSFFAVYHFFIPVEYFFITIILATQIRHKKLQLFMRRTIVAFLLVCIYISMQVQPLKEFPSIHGNIEGVLIIIWCLLVLFAIEPVNNLSIFRLPVFWMALAFLAYFVGTIAVNSVYNYLLASKSPQAKNLFNVFNSISNFLLYIFLIIGIICHKWEAKSLAPS